MSVSFLASFLWNTPPYDAFTGWITGVSFSQIFSIDGLHLLRLTKPISFLLFVFSSSFQITSVAASFLLISTSGKDLPKTKCGSTSPRSFWHSSICTRYFIVLPFLFFVYKLQKILCIVLEVSTSKSRETKRNKVNILKNYRWPTFEKIVFLLVGCCTILFGVRTLSCSFGFPRNSIINRPT